MTLKGHLQITLTRFDLFLSTFLSLFDFVEEVSLLHCMGKSAYRWHFQYQLPSSLPQRNLRTPQKIISQDQSNNKLSISDLGALQLCIVLMFLSS